MTPIERKTTEERLAAFKKALANPWRTLRLAEKGVDPLVIDAETRSMESIVGELEAVLEQS